jgi:aflatoxin B1 aldehyde reductase
MLEEWLAIAEAQGYVKPSVYQGQYNLLCRGFETSLFPLLRKHNIKFNAFSPLAGGFLLGNFTENGVQGGTRFSVASPFLSWYDKPSMHQAVKNLRAIAADTGLTMDEMAIRWLVYHSILSDQDAVILGASKISHVDRSAAQIKKGPLDEAVVSNLEQLWELVLADGRKITEF